MRPERDRPPRPEDQRGWAAGMRWAVVAAASSAGALATLGCTVDDGAAPVPAAGIVSYRGQPIDQGWIMFVPEHGPPAEGRIEGGKFTLTTTRDGDGAIPGTHRVLVIATREEPTPAGPPAVRSVLPEGFRDPETTPITAVIPKGGSRDLGIHLH